MNKKWTEDKILLEAKKYKTKKDFYTFSKNAYYAAIRLGILERIDWFQKHSEIYDLKDTVYAYIFEDLKYAYIGRTISERVKQRDKEHFSKIKNEPTYRFIKEHNIEKVPMVILEKNITVREGIERESYWANYYKKQGYKLINSIKCGGVGSLGGGFWDSKKVKKEALKYKTRGDFAKNSEVAYKYAAKHGLLDTYTWLSTQMKKPLGFWESKENVIKESKKYKSRTDFFKNNSSAYRSAIKHKWLDKFTWLKNERKVKRGFWTIENLKLEANKYENKADFLKNSRSAYVTASKKGILDTLFK